MFLLKISGNLLNIKHRNKVHGKKETAKENNNNKVSKKQTKRYKDETLCTDVNSWLTVEFMCQTQEKETLPDRLKDMF